jgi:hypothetical protein
MKRERVPETMARVSLTFVTINKHLFNNLSKVAHWFLPFGKLVILTFTVAVQQRIALPDVSNSRLKCKTKKPLGFSKRLIQKSTLL